MPELAPEIDAAIAAIDRKLQLRQAAETFFQGLSLGSVLLLAALGLAVTFGVMGVINMAHGEFVMIGAYATVVVQEFCRNIPALQPWSLPLAMPVAFLVTAAIGAAMERGLIRHLYGRPLETLLLTFGVGMVLQQVVRVVFGAQNREVISPPWMMGTLTLPGGISITQNRPGSCSSPSPCCWRPGRHPLTRFGLEMRAVVQNRRIAATMGIRTGGWTP
jgi:urea transport system permease protein